MKKLVAILAVLIVMMASVAYAEEAPLTAAVPSKTSSDVTEVSDPTGTIVKSEDAPEVVEELSKVIAFTQANPEAPVVEFFGDTVKEEIAAVLPEGVDEKALEMNEFVSIAVDPAKPITSDVDVEMTFPTTYAENQAVVALVGIFNGAEVEWIAQQATALANGNVSIHFTQEVLEKMSTATSVSLAILSAPANA